MTTTLGTKRFGVKQFRQELQEKLQGTNIWPGQILQQEVIDCVVQAIVSYPKSARKILDVTRKSAETHLNAIHIHEAGIIHTILNTMTEIAARISTCLTFSSETPPPPQS